MKICTKCGIEKPLSEFRIRHNRKYGEYINTQCKTCEKERYTFICKFCGKEFKDKHKDRMYCSKQCFANDIEQKVEYKCENCGSNVKVKTSTFKKAEHHYCSDACMRAHRPSWYKGELVYNYDHQRSNEERKKIRKSNEDYQFINGVKKRDDYTCQCCGVRGGKLVSHHINSYNWFKEGRYDISNGITLCECCHIEFHKTYGFGNNDKKQLENFIHSKSKAV